MSSPKPDPTPDYQASIEFLEQWLPGGPWVLCSIDPNKKGIDVDTFGGADAKGGRLSKWLEDQGTKLKRNCYFVVNPCTDPGEDPPQREHMTSLSWLHIDLDPRAGEDIAAERERILALLRDPSARGIPKPTCITFSGGGYQAFWRLRVPKPLAGSPDEYEDAKLYNKHLEVTLGGDKCHNVNRLMRLPGTLNRPDKRKREKGRVVELARVEEFGDAIYDLDGFKKVDPERASSSPSNGAAAPAVEFDAASVARVQDLDAELPSTVPPVVKRVIACGRDEENGEPHRERWSRSEWQWWATCELARQGVRPEVIYSILLDPDWGISESVRDKGSGAEAYARRQVEEAYKEADAESAELVLDPGDPLPSARAFVEREAPELMLYNGSWLDYDGAAYREVEDGIIESRLYVFLEHAKRLEPRKQGKGFEEVPFKPNSARVSDVLRALRSVTIRARDQFEPPCWIGEPGPPPREIISCANGLLHLPTGELLPATPSFFTRNALAIAFDPAAPEPAGWLRFLRDLWKGDPESIGVLQEVFGYLLVPDTSQQKLFFLKGPPRSGKGTIARVLRELVGAANVCAPSLPSLGIHFGLEALVGKSLGIVSDARDSGRMEVQASIAENLLRITGEDQVSVPRKFRDALELKLSVRFLIMSNLRPKLPDASGALANRFVPIVMTESFLGREDPGLTAKLLGELPGILNWAIEGWRRLHARGHFEPSATGRAMLVDLVEDASPIMSFVREECELDPVSQVPKQELYEAYRDWRLIQGMSVVDARVFGKDMQAAFPKVEEKRPHIDGARVRVYSGIALAGTEAGRARRLLETWARRPDMVFSDEHERAWERLWGAEASWSGAAWEPGATW